MNNLDNIPKNLHTDVISIYWQMLRDCEGRAHDTNNPVLKHMVEGWYHTWNRMADDTKKPVWVEKYL